MVFCILIIGVLYVFCFKVFIQFLDSTLFFHIYEQWQPAPAQEDHNVSTTAGIIMYVNMDYR